MNFSKDIKVLDKYTIDKIAAGEVVERPANVVKELMENSIDAGATAISVEIADGGRKMIRITDNGCGIPKDQVRTAFLSHATSKISNADDLSFVTTLGFRGEALSSIAAVSDVEICTKTKDDITGIIYRISAGKEVSLEEAGLPDGTTVIVTNLFKYVPVRLKFLKTAQSEGNTISDSIEKIALSHPDISVKFTNNGAVRLNTSGNRSLKDVIYTVFGREMTSNLLEVRYSSDLLSVNGFIGKPEIARGSRAYENYFVNGRYVRDKIISSAIENAYKGFQMKGSFPFTVFNITIEPELMDVNVHPSKMEIRFYDSEAVYNCISEAVSSVLSGRENIPEIREETVADKLIRKHSAPEPFEENRRAAYSSPDDDSMFDDPDSPAYGKQISRDDWNAYSSHVVDDDYFLLTTERPTYNGGYSTIIDDDDDYAYDQVFREHVPYSVRKQEYYKDNDENRSVDNDPAAEPAYEQQSLFTDAFLSEQAREDHRIIGEVFDTYWIVQYGDKMFIIDQHAAHEKVLYERFMNRIRSRDLTSQTIAPGIIVTLSAAEEECLVRNMFRFELLGFQIDHFGGKDYIITAVPADLYGLNNAQLFLSFIDELVENPSPSSPEILNDRIATAACKAAVKGGNRISLEEADALIEELMGLDNPYNCPHGRPTIISMSRSELEKKFKRII